MSKLPRSLGYTPDYQSLIQNDPAYMALAQHVAAQDTTNAAQRQDATEQALIHFGMVPDFQQNPLGLSPAALQMLMHDIDPNAARLAQENTLAGLSTEGQLQQQEEQASHALVNGLAARGALGSGDNNYRTGLQDQAYAKAQNDALQTLLAAINSYQQTYLNAHNAGQDQLNQGLQTAQQFEAGLPQNQGFTLRYDAAHGVYRDGTGNVYHVKSNGDGTWTLRGTNATYTLDQNGKLSNGIHTAPAPSAATAPPATNTGGGGHVAAMARNRMAAGQQPGPLPFNVPAGPAPLDISQLLTLGGTPTPDVGTQLHQIGLNIEPPPPPLDLGAILHLGQPGSGASAGLLGQLPAPPPLSLPGFLPIDHTPAPAPPNLGSLLGLPSRPKLPKPAI